MDFISLLAEHATFLLVVFGLTALHVWLSWIR
jgi:hypothetical protein